MLTFHKIRNWASERNLIEGSNPQAQMLKTIEELGETAGAIARGNLAGVMDGIGDVVVCLTILASQHGLEIEDCINDAWEEIKDRKGRMENGVFIKDGEPQ